MFVFLRSQVLRMGVWGFIVMLLQPALALDGASHVDDILQIVFKITAEENPELASLARYISQGMDFGSEFDPLNVNIGADGSSFLKTARAYFGKIPGDHRAIAHWGLNSRISPSYLAAFEEMNPGRSPELIELWQQYVITRREAVRQALNLSSDEASTRIIQGIAGWMNDVHLLGDYTTKELNSLPPMDDVLRDLETSLHRVFGNNSKEVSSLFRQIKSIMKSSISPKERADAIRDLLKAADLGGDRLNRIISRLGFKGVYSSPNYRALEQFASPSGLGGRTLLQLSSARRLLGEVDGNVQVHPAIERVANLGLEYTKRIDVASRRMADAAMKILNGSDYSDLTAAAKRKLQTTRGFLQRATLKGRTVRILTVRAEAVSYGLKAGILTFVMEEGVTAYGFVSGEIDENEFIFQTAKNGAASIASGAGCFVAVTLGASPTGWVVLAIGTGAYVVTDIVFGEIRKFCDGTELFDEELIGLLPTEMQRRKSAFSWDGIESGLDVTSLLNRESGIDYTGTNPSGLDLKPRRKGGFEYSPSNSSGLQMPTH